MVERYEGPDAPASEAQEQRDKAAEREYMRELATQSEYEAWIEQQALQAAQDAAELDYADTDPYEPY